MSWFRDGQVLSAAALPGVQVSFSDGRAVLRLPAVTAAHSGRYSVRATNGAGQATSTAELLVTGEPVGDQVQTLDPTRVWRVSRPEEPPRVSALGPFLLFLTNKPPFFAVGIPLNPLFFTFGALPVPPRWCTHSCVWESKFIRLVRPVRHTGGTRFSCSCCGITFLNGKIQPAELSPRGGSETRPPVTPCPPCLRS